MQNRLKSKVMWVAVLAQVVVIMQLSGLVELSQIELINGIVTAVIQMLVLFGILNSPTTPNRF